MAALGSSPGLGDVPAAVMSLALCHSSSSPGSGSEGSSPNLLHPNSEL